MFNHYNMKNTLDCEQIAAALECIGDGVVSTDINGIIEFMNNSAESLTGWSITEAVGKPFEMVFPIINIDTKIRMQSPITIALRTGISVGLENRSALLLKDGSVCYISASCSPIKTPECLVSGVIVVFRDITRQKGIEEELRVEKNNLQMTFEYAPMGMLLLDDNTVIKQANNAFLEMLDFDLSNVLEQRLGDGMRCLNSFEKGCGNGLMCTLCDLRKAIKDTLRSGEPCKDIIVQQTLLIDGKEVSPWYKINFVPVTIAGKSHLMIVIDDITDQKMREEELVRSKNYWLKMMDDFPIMVWKDDTSKKYDYVNKALIEFTGLAMEEIIGYEWINKFHKDDDSRCKKIYDEAVDKRIPYEMEHRMRRYDGEYRWVLSAGTPYYDLEDDFVGYIGSVVDITDSKVAKKSLQDSEEKFRMLFNKVTDAIYLHELTEETNIISRIVEVNDEVCKSLGYTRDEIIGRSILDIYNNNSRMEKWDNVNKVIENGTHIYEATHISKIGKEISVEISSHYFMIEDRKLILSVSRDITERKKAKAMVIESEKRYHSLFMNMHSSFSYNEIICNEKGEAIDFRIVEINEATEQFFKKKKEDIVGKKVSKVFSNPADIAAIIAICSDVALNENSRVETGMYFKSLGKWCSLAIYSPRKGYFVTIMTDVTEQKLVEEELRKTKEQAVAANKAKSEFLANMSHEIRTPLNGIVGMIDLTLLDEINEDQKENLCTAKSCVSSLLNIINDILDFSKIEAGKLNFEDVNFNIKELMDYIMKAHSVRTYEKGLVLTYDFSSNIPTYLKGDPNRLQQILNNLISNAIKFTSNGEIIIRVNQTIVSEDYVELMFSVSDTGVGIASENIKKLFRSFSQIDSSFTRNAGGTGLGLVISKQLAELMGGKMWVESEKGKGSTFYFTTIFKLGKKPEEKVDTFAVVNNFHNKLNILLVEDDNVNQIVLSRMLKEKGNICDIASNGLEALDAHAKKKYDVILMDIQMPFMDGIEATRQIRVKEGLDRHTPIIALTAFALQGDREKFLSLGMDEYISKPVKMEDLFITIEKVIQANMYENLDYSERIRLNDSGELVFLKTFEAKPVEELRIILEEISLCIRKITKDIATNDLGIIENAAHRIKELFIQVDAEEMKDIAFKIELGARRGNLKEAVDNILRMNYEYETYKKTLNI